MARISFDNAEQMAMQAQLQATLSQINKKKTKDKEAEKKATAEAEKAASPSNETAEELELEQWKRNMREKKEAVAGANKRIKEKKATATEEFEPTITASVAQHQQPQQEEQKQVVSAASAAESSLFLRATKEVLEAEIGNAEKIVFLYLYANAKDCVVDTTLLEIAKKTYMGKTCVSKALGVLRDCEWISWSIVRNGKIGRNRYSILKFGSSENEPRSESELRIHYPYARTPQYEPKAASVAITGAMGNIEAELAPQSSESELRKKNDAAKSPWSVGITDFPNDLIAALEKFALEDYSPKDLVLKTSPKDWGQSSQSFDIYRLKSLVNDYVFMLSDSVIVDKSLLPQYVIAMFKILFPGQRILDPRRFPATDTTAEIVCISEKLEALENKLKGNINFSWFVMYFTLMKNCPFLSGGGQKGWKCYLDWALSESGMRKILALEYKPNELQSGTRVNWQPKAVADHICMKLRKGEY